MYTFRCLSKIILLIILTINPAIALELPELGEAQGIDANGQPLVVNAMFAGGFALEPDTYTVAGNILAGQPVTISGKITVAPEHVGRKADIIAYVEYASLDDPLNPVLLMLGEGGTILPWDSLPANLIPFVPQVTLGETQDVTIYNGVLPEGTLRIFFGYLLSDALVMNRRAIDMAMETVPEITETEAVTEDSQEEEMVAPDLTPLLEAELNEDRLVGEWAKRWPTGSTLKVGFDFTGANVNRYRPAVCNRYMSASSCLNQLANQVIATARTWSQYGNIYFAHSSWNQANIRVQFKEVGSWSYVGKSAQRLSVSRPTMNLALSFLRSQAGFRRTVLHEFGHALALHHEHISPNVSYNWNEANILADTARSGWSAQTTRSNIIDNLLKGRSRSAFFATRFDPKSIMIYSIPKRWVSAADVANPAKCPNATTSRHYCVGTNSELSAGDKQGIAAFYPRRNTQPSGSCSYTYNPSAYRPGTAQWNGHIGNILFNNPTSSYVHVTLYHPDSRQAFGIWRIPPRVNTWLYYYYSPMIVAMDWGIKVNNSPICILKTASNWRNNYFQASTTRLPGR